MRHLAHVGGRRHHSDDNRSEYQRICSCIRLWFGYTSRCMTKERGQGVANGDLGWIANFIWGIADDVLRDLYVRGKYRDVILPMTVLRRLDVLL